MVSRLPEKRVVDLLKKAIKTKASMEHLRENATEFGHCSAVNKRLDPL